MIDTVTFFTIDVHSLLYPEPKREKRQNSDTSPQGSSTRRVPMALSSIRNRLAKSDVLIAVLREGKTGRTIECWKTERQRLLVFVDILGKGPVLFISAPYLYSVKRTHLVVVVVVDVGGESIGERWCW
jgi:hypothetical protein